MTSRRIRALLGAAMIGLGLLQAALYATQGAWIPTGLGVTYACLGGAYLWIEGSAIE